MSVTIDGSKVTIEINDTLAAGETASEEYTPASGKEVSVLEYVAEIPFSEEVVSCLAWNSVAQWNLRASGSMPFIKVLTGSDGIKKVVLQVDNINASSPQAISARVVLDVR